ncbi:MAG: hypothetical protein LKI80_13695 [Sporolactobacillus sp.]|jgi:hypothetical protein|nr:hypothetical protein [Sporolactobacillus sp.]
MAGYDLAIAGGHAKSATVLFTSGDRIVKWVIGAGSDVQPVLNRLNKQSEGRNEPREIGQFFHSADNYFL